jgi:methylated-DNA-[protein]-cysteine S-methyltransferase
MRILYHVISAPSPLGLLFVAATENGLRYLEFLDRRSLKRAIAAHSAANPGATWEPSVRALRPLAELLEQYFSGGAKHLNVVLDVTGSEFEHKVWKALLEIPYGETRSYGDIAKVVGEPRAARAVGLACNANPVAIVVPCHRVIGADGKLVGYSGGVPRKKFLIALESRFRDVLPLDGDSVIAPMHRKVKRGAATVTPARSVSRSGRAPAPAKPARRRTAAPAAKTPARASRVRSK